MEVKVQATHSETPVNPDSQSDLANALQKQSGVMIVASSLEPEYRNMFGLRPDLPKHTRILDMSGGVSSFCAEMHALGYEVYAADPLYNLSSEEIGKKASAVLEVIAGKFRDTTSSYRTLDGTLPAWLVERPSPEIDTPSKLLALRSDGLASFLSHYENNRHRYFATSLPELDGFTPGKAFDLILSGHFLMAYTSNDLDFTANSIINLAKFLSPQGAIKIFPAGSAFEHVQCALSQALRRNGLHLEVVPASHRFVTGWDAMYRVTVEQR